MFYVMNNDKLALFDDDLTKLQSTRKIMPQLTEETRETDIITEDELRLYPNKVIAVPNEEEVEVVDYDVETGEEIGKHTENRVYYTLDLNPDFEAEQAQKEAERIGNLKCTKRVFALMLQELGITYTQLKQLISTNEQAELEWDLCVELERKNPLLDIMAGTLGITPIQLDGLFKYANGEITLEEFKGFTPVEASESDTGVLADGE